MGTNKLDIIVKGGKVTLDIPGHGTQCDAEMDDIVATIENFIPEESISHGRKERREEEVNQIG